MAGWGGVRPSNSQFDGLELIWVFASAEMNFSCWSPSRKGKNPLSVALGAFSAAVWGRFFFFFPFSLGGGKSSSGPVRRKETSQ